MNRYALVARGPVVALLLVGCTFTPQRSDSHTVQRCSATELFAETSQPDPNEMTSTPSKCSSDVNGFGMSFALAQCQANAEFATCQFLPVSFDTFDADHGGIGVLEVAFCVDAPIHAAIDIYYGSYPRRKVAPLLSDAEVERGLAAGCYVRRFRPADIQCPIYTDPIAQDPASQLPEECRHGCGSRSADAGAVARPARWADKGAQCLFDYDATILSLTVEYCKKDPQVANLTDTHVRKYGDGCTCLSDNDCTDPYRPFCNLASTVSDPRCPDGIPCAGLCATES